MGMGTCGLVGPFFGLRCTLAVDHSGDHQHNGGYTGVTRLFASWPEPEPEKPREWLVHQYDAHGTIICQQNHDDTYRRPFLVHDADQCDRLRKEKP